MNKIKLVIAFTILLSSIGMGIVIPVLPHYVSSFGASPFEITSLFSVFSFCAFLSSPLLGSLSDKFGRRPLLIISILSTFLGWLVFSLAGSLWLLYLGRIIDGIAAGNVSIAQGSLVDISKSDKERTSNLGLIGASFGIGYVIGPLLGGILSAQSHVLPFWVITILSFVNLLVAFFFLPETHKEKNLKMKTEINPFAPLLRAVKNKLLLPRYIAWFLYILGMSSVYSIFALYLESAFGYGAATAGFFFTAMGATIALNQLVILRYYLLKRFRELDLEFWMLAAAVFGYFLIGIKIILLFVACLVILAFSQSVVRVTMSSIAVGKAGKNSKGETLGIMSSIQAIAMAVGPILAGLAFGVKIYLPFVLSGVYTLIAFLIVFYYFKNNGKIKPDEDTPIPAG